MSGPTSMWVASAQSLRPTDGGGDVSGEFELKLEETGLPPGEIELRDLANVSAKLQELATRVGRWVAGIDRTGRSTADVEDAVGLRLTEIRTGSTVLALARGPVASPLFDAPLEEQFDTRMWQTLNAIGNDAPEDETPARVRESALGLLDALDHAAGRVVVSRSDGARFTFRPVDRDRQVWATVRKSVDEQEVTLSGVVKAVDLDSRRFRLQDDVGNRIPLEGIDDVQVARELLDRRADAVGLPVRDARGRIQSLQVSSIDLSHVPEAWTASHHDNSWQDTDLPGPDPDGGVELSDDEWSSLMAVLKGE